MRKQELSHALSNAMTGVKVSPALRRRTLDAICGKETVIVKKKLSLAALIALLAVMLCAAALAAASRAGMFDFIARYTEVPIDAASYLQTNVAQGENELVSACVRELYYDGRIARMTVDVTPQNKEMLLIGLDSCLGYPCSDLFGLTAVEDDKAERTLLAYAQEKGYAQISHVDIGLLADEGKGLQDASADAVLADDGTLILFYEGHFQDEQAERPSVLSVMVTPYEQPYTEQSRLLPEQRTRLEIPVALNAAHHARANDAPNVYVSAEPVLFPSVGVRVDEVRIEATAMELYAQIDFTVIDREAYLQTEEGLFFEWIDPDSQATVYASQRLKEGLSGGGSVRPLEYDVDNPNEAVHFRQEETLALNELRPSYTLRAFNCWSKERYETQTVEMKIVE